MTMTASAHPLVTLPGCGISHSRIGYGCGGLADWAGPVLPHHVDDAARLVHGAIDAGLSLFDLADIYAYGRCEQVFGEVLKRSPALREAIVLQTKCGIRLAQPIGDPPADDPHRFDLGHDHIVGAVESSLRRLNTDRIDILLLHRPDPLADLDETARALEALHAAGKVRAVGVSNHSPAAMALLRQRLAIPLGVNQLRLGLTHPDLITEGLDFNRAPPHRFWPAQSGASGALEQFLRHDVVIQAWSPVRGIMARDAETGAPLNAALDAELAAIAAAHGCDAGTIALAWLLRHPARIVPIIGTRRLEAIQAAAGIAIQLSAAQWWRLLYAATGLKPAQAI